MPSRSQALPTPKTKPSHPSPAPHGPARPVGSRPVMESHDRGHCDKTPVEVRSHQCTLYTREGLTDCGFYLLTFVETVPVVDLAVQNKPHMIWQLVKLTV